MNGKSNGYSNGVLPNENVFHPEDLLNINSFSAPSYAIMILNRPVNFPTEFIIPFWNKASVRITVDGGTNRWYKFLENNQINSKDVSRIDIVSGDFDSITEDVLNEMKANNSVKVIHTPDQNETDFTKAIKLLSIHCQERNIHLDSLIVICQSSGRIDQTIGNINTLHKYHIERWMDSTALYILSDDSISWLLNKGTSNIQIPDALLKSSNTWCALMPIGSKAVVSSKGLKWNLDNTTMEFGGLVSTSNKFGLSNQVTVTSDSHLLWAMNIIPLFSKLYGIVDTEFS